MTIANFLSVRGNELAALPDLRGKFAPLLGNMWDPRTNPDGYVNIGVAENYAMLDEVAEFIEKNITFKVTDFSYGEGPWGTKRLREAMADFINTSPDFNVYTPGLVREDEVLFTNGVTSLCEMLGFAVADAGDGLLLSRPIYQAFQMDFGVKAKVKPVFVDFDGVDQFSPDSVDKYEEAFIKAEQSGTRVRVMILCNPHNPLGKCYPKDTIKAYMRFCNKYKIHLISDEIYATSVYEVRDKDAVPFTSAVSFDYSEFISPELLHLFYGMSKDFGAGGVRLGCIFTKSRPLMHALNMIAPFHWSGGPSQSIGALILESKTWLAGFNALSRHRLSERNELTRSLLEANGIEYYKGANAGFFLWVNLKPYLPQIESSNPFAGEEVLAKKMLEHRLFLTAGEQLAAEEPGWFRVIFSQTEETIMEGMDRLLKAIGKR